MIGQTVSHYRILEKLGEGGMGVVYKAQDAKLDRIVALKFLPSHVSVNEETKARFLQEAKAAAALNHPSICTIYGVEESDGKMFIAMEYVEGGTLRKRLPFHKINDALSIAIQIGEALQEAHSKDIIHRDIKADNIMLTSKGQAKVMDFGLAKLKGSLKLTRTSSTVGTLAYMAPEQIQGGEVDHRGDIFSFGVLLFEMLTGKLPFRGEHEAAMMYSILNEQPYSLQNHLPEVPSELVHVLNRALEKDPEDRYQHADDMASELRRVLKSSRRVVRAPLGDVPAQPMSGKIPKIHDTESKAFETETVAQPQRRTRQFVVLAIVTIALLAVVMGYFSFRGKNQSVDSLAVLPFENVGADPNTEYLSDGITESLTNTMSQLSNLTVMSSSSVFHYKGKDIDPQKAGNELGVKAVLIGRVTQRGDNLQISTELVNVSDNSHIWGQQYNKKLSDILAVQEDITKEISYQLRLRLVGEDEKKLAKHSTEDTEAYQLYLKGRFYWNKRKVADLDKAVSYFNRAIDKDPGYALAYAGLASTYSVLPEYSNKPPKDFMLKAEKAARKAMELDAMLAEPHAVLGYNFQNQWDWEGAESEFKQAIELNPNYPTAHQWYSETLEAQGKLEEALSESKRGQELDPISPIIGNQVGAALFYMQRYDLAIEQFNRVLEIDQNFHFAHMLLGSTYAQQGKFVEAISEIQRAREIVGADDLFGMGQLGYAYARAGKKNEAIKVLNQMLEVSKKGYALSVQIAYVYAGLGDKDKAFEWLEKGYNEQNRWFGFIKVQPMWNSLRSDGRFTAMLRKIRLNR
ncbi:hypothetical protein D4R75_15455 [bacterium]|nr:MAG: hypothetical protein D4R75_15455 [bacterium]